MNESNLPAFRVTTASGYSWEVSMAPGTTLEAAKAYFIGEIFEIGDGLVERAVKVEEIS